MEVGGWVGWGGMLCLVQQVAAQLVQLRPAFAQGQWRVDLHFDFVLHLQHGFKGCLSAASVTFVWLLWRLGRGKMASLFDSGAFGPWFD